MFLQGLVIKLKVLEYNLYMREARIQFPKQGIRKQEHCQGWPKNKQKKKAHFSIAHNNKSLQHVI